MRTNFYEIKKNSETKELEMVNVLDFNYHSSLLQGGKVEYSKIVSRERAKNEYFSLIAKQANNNITTDDLGKIELYEKEFNFNSKTDACSDISDASKEIRGLIALDLFAHNALNEGLVTNKKGDTILKKARFSLGLDMFYAKTKTTVAQIKSGAITIEQAVEIIKPLYNDCTIIINHDGKKDFCKKWVESTREKNTRAFVTGLLPRYKITKKNMISENSPLKNQTSFEQYVAMWLITQGSFKEKVSKGNNTRSLESLVNNGK